MEKKNEIVFSYAVRLQRHFPWVLLMYDVAVTPEEVECEPVSWTKWWWSSYIGLLALIAIEMGYFLREDSSVRRGLAILWIVISVGFIVSVIVTSLAHLFDREFWRSKEWGWYLAVVLLPISAMLIGVTGIEWLSALDRGALQLTTAMTSLQTNNSLGVYDRGYEVGYPIRQYILAYVPSYLFGRSLLMVRLGFFSFFLVGYLAFIPALARFLQSLQCPKPWLIASAGGVCVAMAPYTILTVRLFEQTLTPISVTLLLAAGLVKLAEKPTGYRYFWVGWTLGFIPYCYPNALAVTPVGVVALFAILFYRRYRSLAVPLTLFYGVLATVVGSLILNLNYHDSIEVYFQRAHDSLGVDQACWRYFQGATQFFIGPRMMVVPAPIALCSLVIIYFSVRSLDWRFPAVMLWTLVCGMASMIWVEDVMRAPDYDLYRSCVVIPILVAGILMYYGERCVRLGSLNKACEAMARITIIYMLYTGCAVPLLHRDGLEFNANGDPTDYELITQCLDNYRHTGAPVKKVYLVPPVPGIDIDGFLKYFCPDGSYEAGSPPPDEKKEGYIVITYKNWKAGDPRPDHPILQADKE